MNVEICPVDAVYDPKGAEHMSDVRGREIGRQLRGSQPLRRISDEGFAREQIMNLVGSFEQLVATEAENARVRRRAVLQKGGCWVTEDHQPLARSDDHPLRAIAAVLVDGLHIVAKLRDP